MGTAGKNARTVTLGGAFSKRQMAGPLATSDISISTAWLNRILQYDPADLTVSAGAGVRWCELSRTLAEQRQMIPLDPPFSDEATVGGVVASNCSGPRRRLYGTARDLVIGMDFATLDGRLARSGGMVVKNVAGLDMAKVLIGSFGTLAAIAVVNFKVMPRPERERTFLLSFDSAQEADRARLAVLRGVLQPEALDLFNPEAAEAVDASGWLLAVQAGGNGAVVERYRSELEPLGGMTILENAEEAAFWRLVANFTPRYLATYPEGAVARISCTLKDVASVMEEAGGSVVARAGSGVVYAHFRTLERTLQCTSLAVRRGWKTAIDFAPEARKAACELWPAPGPDLELMKRVKRMFDPESLLNRDRMYGRI